MFAQRPSANLESAGEVLTPQWHEGNKNLLLPGGGRRWPHDECPFAAQQQERQGEKKR
jgi:hypothetical protein